MRKLGLKQDLGDFLQEKLSSRGFWAKTRDLNIIKPKTQGVAHKNLGGRCWWTAGSILEKLEGLNAKTRT